MEIKLPSYFNNLVQFATRPMTVQRIEWAGSFYENIYPMRMVCIPFDGGDRVLYIQGDDLKNGFKDKEISSPSVKRGKLLLIRLVNEIDLKLLSLTLPLTIDCVPRRKIYSKL